MISSNITAFWMNSILSTVQPPSKSTRQQPGKPRLVLILQTIYRLTGYGPALPQQVMMASSWYRGLLTIHACSSPVCLALLCNLTARRDSNIVFIPDISMLCRWPGAGDVSTIRCLTVSTTASHMSVCFSCTAATDPAAPRTVATTQGKLSNR